MTATNASGTGPASAAGPLGGVVPSTTPAAPSAPTVVVAGLNGQATVTWTAPNNGGSTITGYTLNPTPACPGCTGLTAAASPTTVSGLTNGTSYTFTLVATNANGNSAASSASTAAVVGIPATPAAPATLSDKHRRTGLCLLDRPRLRLRPDHGLHAHPEPGLLGLHRSERDGQPGRDVHHGGRPDRGFQLHLQAQATNASGPSAASAASTGVVTGAPTAPTTSWPGRYPGRERRPHRDLVRSGLSGVGTINNYTATSSPGSKTCTSTSTAPATPA